MKGDSETHPALSPDDEFADFETWDLGYLIVTKRTTPELRQFEYSRSALKHGLAQDEILGKNPFKGALQAFADVNQPKKIIVKNITDDLDDLADCHIVFVSRSQNTSS